MSNERTRQTERDTAKAAGLTKDSRKPGELTMASALREADGNRSAARSLVVQSRVGENPRDLSMADAVALAGGNRRKARELYLQSRSPQRDSEDGVETIEVKPRGGGQATVSRLQIVRDAPPSYAGPALTDNDFFISFGLYNAIIPSNIDDKITLGGTATNYFWLEITLSATNPAFASAVAIGHGTTLPVNAPTGANVWPTTVYILLGHVSSVDGAWVIQNYDNGNAAGGAYVSTYEVDNDGIVTVRYGFSHARFS